MPAILFESLKSLEILNLQNNRLSHFGEDIFENIVDTLRLIDITGKEFKVFVATTYLFVRFYLLFCYNLKNHAKILVNV